VVVLASGLLIFILTHLIREIRLRDRLIQVLGMGPYKIAYSLAALLGLILIVWGKSIAPFVMVWQPAYELRQISHFLMLPALVLFTAGNLPHSHLRFYLRHPMLLGTVVWGAAHLWANGDFASILLFGSLGAWALIKFFSLLKQKSQDNEMPGYLWDITAVIVGFVLYGVIFVYHGDLFGVGLSFA
jgi:uncharacterized membrane protein